MMRQYFKKMLFGLFCCLQISYIFCQKVLIKIDRIVRELDNSISIKTECDIKNWANQLSNACKCCLFKWVPKIGTGPGQKTVDQIVQECISNNYCTQKLIEDFKNSVPDAPDLTTALYQLYNNAVVIKKISKEGIAFDEEENLTEQGVKTFLEKAYKEKKLPYEAFKSAKCIEVKNIFAEKRGVETAQLFLINSTCSTKPSSYILKEAQMLAQAEIERMLRSFQIEQLDDLILPNHIKDYPSLAIPFAFLQYNSHNLYLAPLATGRQLEEFFFDYFSDPSEKKRENLEQALFDVGFTLAKFHQRFMKDESTTLIHGDFHYKNIFYDITTRQITLIDMESLKYDNPMEDVAQLIRSTFSPPGPYDFAGKKVVTLEAWSEFMIPFLKGYFSGYPKKDWPALFNKLVMARTRATPVFSFKLVDEIQEKKNLLDKRLETIKQFIQNNEEHKTHIDSVFLKNSLVKLTNSLSALAKFLSIG